MKKIIDYFKSLRISTIYKIVGVILFVGIVIWLVIITNKMNDLAAKKTNTNTNTNSNISSVSSNSDNLQNSINDVNTINNSLETKEESNSNLNTDSASEDKDTYVTPDLAVLSYFSETESELKNASLREKAKEKFITIVDFLFYGGEINGYTFSEISTKTKLKVLQIALSIDAKIDSYFPGYKETITSTTSRVYTNIKEIVVKKYLELTTKICTNDPETCESAKQGFQEMKKSFSITWDLIKDLASSGVSNLKEWYEIYSGK